MFLFSVPDVFLDIGSDRLWCLSNDDQRFENGRAFSLRRLLSRSRPFPQCFPIRRPRPSASSIRVRLKLLTFSSMSLTFTNIFRKLPDEYLSSKLFMIGVILAFIVALMIHGHQTEATYRLDFLWKLQATG